MLFVAIDFHASIYIFVWVLQGGKFNKQEFTLLKIVHTDQVAIRDFNSCFEKILYRCMVVETSHQNLIFIQALSVRSGSISNIVRTGIKTDLNLVCQFYSVIL